MSDDLKRCKVCRQVCLIYKEGNGTLMCSNCGRTRGMAVDRYTELLAIAGRLHDALKAAQFDGAFDLEQAVKASADFHEFKKRQGG
jgi:hypothetical protein